MSQVFVAIVNFRTARLAVEAVASLADQRDALCGGKVIVVDNDSGDDSLRIIAQAISERDWSGWVELLPLPHNGGFSYGNNEAIRRVRSLCPDFAAVILLNPDAIARPGALAALVAHLDAHSRVGIAGACIEDGRGALTVSSHAMPSPLGELEAAAHLSVLSRLLANHAVSTLPRNVSHECDWVSGACMAIRREVLEGVGLFDEGFFLYFEEVDLCRRAGRAGWACWLVSEARVVHFEGAATRIKEVGRPLPAYWFDSRRRFFVKAYGVVGLLAADACWALGRASLVARRALGLGGRSGAAEEPARMTRDLLGSDARALLRGELALIAREV